ncbi:MAG: acyl-CoA dehydrogenase [Gammaproteobacteria bacterium]|nr:acyl-CoA dehydrogenase [Gammaproteobacteria bacterium]
MSFTFTDEQTEFRGVLRRFLDDKSPPTEVRRLMATDEGMDAAVWRQLCDELALAGMHIPQEYGGAGFGFVELGIVLEEMGRALLCAPYFSSSVLAAGAIMQAGRDAERRELLPAIAAGTTRAALALTEANGRWDAGGVRLTATPADGAYKLDGTKRLVVDGCTAELLVVVGREPGTCGNEGLSFFTVDADSGDIKRRLLNTVDTTRKLAEITFNGARAEPLGPVGQGAAALEAILIEAAVALANESAGGAQKMFDSALEYTQLRMQFGRPIGSFQAIKHRMADNLVALELAKSAAYYAAAAVADRDNDLPALASLAKAGVSDAYMHLAAECIQLHGGIGFTWENDSHLWFKRAKSSEVFLGDPGYHRELLMQRWDV